MRTLVVLPTYQEAASVVTVLERLRAAVPDATLLVVDDGSPDGTADLAEAAGERLGNVEVLRRERKSGLGSAYRAGFALGLARGFEVMVEIDADGSHDPAALPTLLARIEGGADLVIGSRYVPGGSIPDWTRTRRLISRGGNRYAATLLRLDVHDATAGYRAYRATMLRRLVGAATRADGYGFQVEMVYRVTRLGGVVEEVPITFTDRVVGDSKMTGRIVLEALVLVTVWGIRDRLPGGRRRAAARFRSGE